MIVQETLRLTPVTGQVRYRATLFPPIFSIATTNLAAALAGKLAEAFYLKSSNILFNQSALSTQYLSFRYVVPAREGKDAQIRYLDVFVGADQVEMVFVNPASVSDLKGMFLKVWDPVIDITNPRATEHYIEASIHSTTEGNTAKQFLDAFVNVEVNNSAVPIDKGFSVAAKYPDTGARGFMSLECSTVLPNGLFLFFTHSISKVVENTASIGQIIDSTIDVYGSLQSLTHVQVSETQ